MTRDTGHVRVVDSMTTSSLSTTTTAWRTSRTVGHNLSSLLGGWGDEVLVSLSLVLMGVEVL